MERTVTVQRAMRLVKRMKAEIQARDKVFDSMEEDYFELRRDYRLTLENTRDSLMQGDAGEALDFINERLDHLDTHF